MKIDIQEIVNAKLKEMEEGKVLETLITSTVEKAVTKAVTDAIGGYSIKRILEDKIEKDVKAGVEQVGFTAYNTLVTEQVSNLINTVLKDDLAEKVQRIFEQIMINKRESIKLSEIIDEYKKLYEDMDYDEYRDLEDGHFYVDWEEEQDGSFRHLKLIMAQEQQDKSSGLYSSNYSGSEDKKLELRLCSYKDKNASISSVRFEGKKLNDLSTLRRISDFEALLMNLYLNKTEVEIDIEDEDDIETYVEGYDD